MSSYPNGREVEMTDLFTDHQNQHTNQSSDNCSTVAVSGTSLMGHHISGGTSGGLLVLNQKRTDLLVQAVENRASDVSAYPLQTDPRIPATFQSIAHLPEFLPSNLGTSTAARTPILPGAYAVYGILSRPGHDSLAEYQQPELCRTLAQHTRPTIPGADAIEGVGTGHYVVNNWGEYGQVSEATSVTAQCSESMSASTTVQVMDHDSDNQQMELLEPVVPPKGRHYWRKKLFLALSLQANCVFSIVLLLLVVLLFVLKAQGINKSHTREQQNGVVQIPNIPGTDPTENQVAPTTFLDSLNLPDYTMQAMERPRSPQSRAYQWLTNNLNNQNSSLQLLPEWRLVQRFALATFYYSTRGEFWVQKHGWMDWDTNECNWEQTHFGKVHSPELHCNDKGEIKALEFWITNNLEGTLPPEISILGKSLQKLAFLRDMQVEGTIPTEVGLLTKLTMLNFNTVAISGTLPTELGFLQSLEELVISTTPISGSLPSEFGKLGNLTIFKVVNTDLTGSLPVEFFRMHQLTVAVMASPGLISDSLLPEIIRNMPRLQFLALDQRKSGDEMPLPSEIGMLSELDNLHLVDWKIDGTVPTELGHLTELNFLTVRENSIAGTMPPELFELTNLIGLDIQANHLEGSLPPVLFSKLTNLQYLRINNNQFSGSIPTEVGLLSNLKKLQLQNTNLLGPLPITELLAMRNLTSLEVANTSLSGSIPKEMCGRMRMQEQGWFGGRFYEGKSENPVCHGTLLCGCNCTGCL